METKTIFLLFLLISTLSIIAKTQSQVLVLGDKNLTQTLQENQYVMLEFYAPWCGHCKHLAPQYQKLPALVQGLGVKIGKIDATVQTASAQKYSVQGYPTLFFISKGRTIDYKGGRNAQAMSAWITNIVNAKVQIISQQQAIQISKENKVVILRTKSTQKIETLRIARASDDTTKYYIIDSAVETLTLYLKDQQPLIYDGKLQTASITNWVTRQTLPTIIPLSDSNAMNYVFSQNKKDMVIIIQYNDISDDSLAIIEKFCQDNEQSFICTICKQSDEIYQGVKGYFKITDEESNKLTYIKSGYSSAFIANFKPQESTAETLAQWKSNIDSGKETSVVESQQQESQKQIQYKNVIKLTNQNFDTFIKENPLTFMQFYATFCGHCKSFAPVYEKFATELIAAQSQYKIAAVNCQQQETLCQKHSIQGYPTLKFFYNGIPIDYQGERKGLDIKQFMDKVKDSKPVTVSGLQEVQKPAAVIFDEDQTCELRMVSAMFMRYPVYHVRKSNDVKVQFLGEDQDFSYDGQLNEKDVSKWLSKVSAPAVVDLSAEQLDPQVSQALQNQLPMLLLIINQQNKHENILQQMKKYCKKTKDQIICGFATKGAGLYENIIQWLNLKNHEQNKNYLIWVNTTNINSVVYDKELTEVSQESIKDYITRIQNGQFDETQQSDNNEKDDDKDNDEQDSGDNDDKDQKDDDNKNQDKQEDDSKGDQQGQL